MIRSPQQWPVRCNERNLMAVRRITIPRDVNEVVLRFGERDVRLTNLNKVFWKKLDLRKRDLLQYYADIAPYLIPHVAGRAMVMKRYPNGAEGEFFYMKRAPEPRPEWIELCPIPHNAGLVEFPIVQDLPSLLWLINLGCIDLNPWYARCDDYDRPDFLHFDLDPGPGADFARVRTVALHVRDILGQLGMPSYAKTTGSKGIHVYIPIVRGPLQKEVWTFAKALAIELESRHPDVITAEYRKVKRPHGRVLVDYNQNAWGRTLASIYSVRPTPVASVSVPVTWEEVERGIRIEDFRIDNAVARVKKLGDLWKPVVAGKKRFDLRKLFTPPKKGSGKPAARR
jgi:bifunctional non-homologous end joining protein LigD